MYSLGGKERYEDQESLYDPYYDYGYGQAYDGAYGTDTGYSGGSAGYGGGQGGYSDYGYGYPAQGNTICPRHRFYIRWLLISRCARMM